MKILRLRFRNLNSLAGEWDIDFTHPAYVSSGIFAITGPTGAGKSTVLDGICLALYGQTPRLSRITQSENEIMSRQTGDCSAEVEFETGKGRFRCHWSQHRSRKQADGLLQSPKHEIVDAASGTVLESKLKGVAAKVEEVTGMDFDRFTRSMLLAQGGFAAFLQATPDKRAPILEQITGTAIYSRISIKVHELTTEERRKLEALRGDLNGLQLLTPEEEAELRRELAHKERAAAEVTTVAHEIREQKGWVERIVLLEAELAQAEQAWLSFQVKKEAHLPDMEQLARGGQALALEGEYAYQEGVRKQQESERSELARGGERLPGVRQGGLDAALLLEKAELTLQSFRTEQARQGESIRKTREFDLKLQEASVSLQGLEREIETIRKQQGGYRGAITTCEAELDSNGTALQSVETFLAEHHADAALAEALTGLEQQVKGLRLLGGQSSERQRQLDRQTAVCGNGEQIRQRAEIAWQEAKQAVDTAEDRLGKISLKIETLLQGRELPAWRDGADKQVNRLNRLQTVHESLVREEEAGRKLEALRLRRETLDHSRDELSRKEETLTGERGLREELVSQLQEKVVLLNRVRDLETERKKLLDGAPCPLCGALEHPYALGNVPSPDATAQALELAREAAKESGERLSGLKADQAGVMKELEQNQREQEEFGEVAARDELFSRAVMAELELNAVSGKRSAAVLSEAQSCREALAGHRVVICQVEQGEEEERGAKRGCDKARQLLAGQDKARHAAAVGFDAALAEQGRLQREAALLRHDLDRALAEVERALEPYGCREISLRNVEELFLALAGRRRAHGERLQEKERLVGKQADLGGELRKQQALLGEAERILGEREELLRDKQAQRVELAGRRRELFGELNPESEEKRWADVVRKAGEQRDAAWREQNRLQVELARLEEEMGKRTTAILERTAKLAELEPALLRKMISAGFSDEAAFLQARLPRGRFDELARLDESFRREGTEAETRRQDRTALLLREREKELTGKSLVQILEEESTVAASLSELQKGVGALDQQLRLQLEQQRLQQGRLQEMELRKKECGRWERLHELIGSSDGKKFRNFAQGLTFEVMVSHANRQLQKMSDRYLLARDNHEPLELNVIDNYQAGEIRSTKNLSGGESFIVSLALALGLSNMASRTVRVDSLFLDEGFGTLDEDALETALETLSGLQQEGKLIGIISHVPALKERIGTQIQVEAGSAGRSSLSGPGCRRIVPGVCDVRGIPSTS